VREAVTGIASSFRSLSDAMADRNRRGVNASVLKTRASYKVLKSTCQLD
jgi:hypothetical protein